MFLTANFIYAFYVTVLQVLPKQKDESHFPPPSLSLSLSLDGESAIKPFFTPMGKVNIMGQKLKCGAGQAVKCDDVGGLWAELGFAVLQCSLKSYVLSSQSHCKNRQYF